MKRVIVICIALCLSATVAEAGILEIVRLQGGIGASVPVASAEFHDLWNIGPSVGVGISHELKPGLEAVLHLDFYSYSLNDKKMLEFGESVGGNLGVTGGRISHYTAMANLKVPIGRSGSRALPYVLGGIGIFKRNVGGPATAGRQNLFEDLDNPPSSETTFALQFGAGLDIVTVMGYDFYIEARLLAAPTEGDWTSTIPFKFGVRTK